MIALAATLEMVKALVLNRKSTEIFANVQSDKDMIASRRVESFYNEYVLQHYQTGKEIRMYGQQSLVERELDRAQQTIITRWNQAFRKALTPNLLFQIMNILSRTLMYGFAVMRAASGILSPGEVIAFALYFEKISAGVSELSDAYGLLQTCPTFCKQYFAIRISIRAPSLRKSAATTSINLNSTMFPFAIRAATVRLAAHQS